MTFLAAERLWLLLGVLALVVAYFFAQRRRRRHAVRFAALPLLARVAPSPGWRRHLPAGLFLLMTVLLVTGFARPQADVRVPREQATVMVAIDLSGSMRADDVSPDRFTVAQQAAEDFVDQLPDRYRVGLVPFASSASVAVPPTTDHELVVSAIRGLQVDGATAIGDALVASVQGAREGVDTSDGSTGNDAGPGGRAPGDPAKVPARVVLLSDGQSSRGVSVEQGIRTALDAKVPVSTIAYGTDSGMLGLTPVPVDRDTLAQIADETGGKAYQAATAEQLRSVYEDLGSSIGFRVERTEITSWFIGFGLVAALFAALASLRFTGRLP